MPSPESYTTEPECKGKWTSIRHLKFVAAAAGGGLEGKWQTLGADVETLETFCERSTQKMVKLVPGPREVAICALC